MVDIGISFGAQYSFDLPQKRTIETRFEATDALDSLMDFFDHDVNKLLLFAGPQFKNRKPKGQETNVMQFLDEQVEGEDGEFTSFNWWKDDYGIAGDLEDLEDLERSVEEEMTFMQMQRRRESMLTLQKRMSTADPAGRRMSRLEAKDALIEAAMEIAAQEEQEDEVMEAEEAALEEEEEPEPEPDFKYLPYIPIDGDTVDIAVAGIVNSGDLDVLIVRPDGFGKKKKANKRVYKVCGVTYTVRCIHGMLIAKEDGSSKWDEFGPVLEKVYAAFKDTANGKSD